MSDPFTALPDRFLDKIYFEPNTGCWLWTGYRSPDGYGRFGADGVVYQAHRYSYLQLVGPIPDELVLDHWVCKTRPCANPAHVRVVTRRINSVENSCSPAAGNAAKTHCTRGHPLDAHHTYHARTDRRDCVLCARLRAAQHREAKRSA